MKHFGRSLLNPTHATVLSTFATETSSGEPASNATPFSSRRVDRNDDGMVDRGEFCLLGGNEQTFRKAGAGALERLHIHIETTLGDRHEPH